MSISPRSGGARWPQRLPHFKYNALKWTNRFTRGLNAAKNTDYINFSLNHVLI